MLRSKALIPLLAQVNTGGVKSTMLLSTDGRLLCHTGGLEVYETDRVISAVMAATYSEYAATARNAIPTPITMDFLLIDLEEGRLALTPIHDKYLLCCYAENSAEIGAIKLKLEAAKRDLAEPLARVGTADSASADLHAGMPAASR